MKKEKIIFACPVLLTLFLLVFLFINLVSISLLSPHENESLTERRPLFRWMGLQNEYIFYLDENPHFTSPLKLNVRGNVYSPNSELDFGEYYWKVESPPFSSPTQKFTIVSSVIVSRNNETLKNEGNTPLLVHTSRITGAFVLGVNESLKIGEEENVVAEQV